MLVISRSVLCRAPIVACWLATFILCASCSRSDPNKPASKPITTTQELPIQPPVAMEQERPSSVIRFATFNVSLYRENSGQLVTDLKGGKNQQAHDLAAIIQHVRPDALLLNEFDYDPEGAAVASFLERYLQVDHGDARAIDYDHHFYAECNTGVPSGMDLDNNGQTGDPADCLGYGTHPGQYGMLVLSRLPIRIEEVRTFQKFLWNQMPDANLPKKNVGSGKRNDGMNFYSNEELEILPLSSKSHWDVPIAVGNDVIHFLVCHPTPPVFDGPEDRNGKRNHDEIRLFADYVDPSRSSYLVDDRGKRGGLPDGARFVVAGDLNADPMDGDSFQQAANQLLQHSLIQAMPTPSSRGAVEQRDRGANAQHRGNPAHDTGDFNDKRTGNLRIDYVLPSRTLQVRDTGVFWPKSSSPLHSLINATDHRLVWVDVSL